MVLPADGSPTLEGLPDNGKEHGKVWLNETDMVSEDHREESRYSTPPQSVDCSISSSEDEVGHDCTIHSSGSSTTSSNEDEVGNKDQDGIKAQLRVVQVLQPNIKFLWGIEVLEQSLKLLNSTVHQLCSADSSLTVADVASQLLEILPPNFKYVQVMGVAQKPQEDTAPSTSLEFTSGLVKQEEPILRPEKSRPVSTLQHHQVGLKEDVAHVTSVTGINRKRTKDSDAEEELPSKRTKYSDDASGDEVLESTLRKVAWRCLSPWTSCEDPGLSSPVLSPSCEMARKRPGLSSPVLSPSPLTPSEDPILSPCVFSSSPLTLCEIPIPSPDSYFWMETEEDAEEEPMPSTSSGITARASSRYVWFRPRYVLSSDSD
ncbi:uncharacterized protein LOC103469976 [Poecilia reticulata]|uniref:uncharacterized protein LOC103469976 n=1 Tax=Poecilia reticulata TaxID=8081 RepID=UPI0004A4E2B8|nr:PREDICTED: uncharacterized protein LOC103469976 [Poecilia reticulata]XP_008416289.1 PREDICTED: uncharacterized protein LOC103469976 [Poecilia reticulata]XP_008416291.1 PREDICTED: uncharacterized protein LOC103469976 [Poecilia reticulata]XP_008416292.1 PREDICTED: uncharacterized protein LOC103469976 [Poecilia reticulata]XP_008416293.1 PREDICTED: uncharacterized protein LOC103469976 [Poecilia reticulata]